MNQRTVREHSGEQLHAARKRHTPGLTWYGCFGSKIGKLNFMRSHGRIGHRGRLVAALVIVLLLGSVAAVLFEREQLADVVVPPAVEGTPVPIVAQVTNDERAYYEFVGGRLRALTAEAAALAKLGNERSRNIVELQVRRDRVTLIADQIDAFVETTALPPRFSTAMTDYDVGMVALRSGMEEATSAFFRFDWDAVATGLVTFERGAAQLDSAYLQLRSIVAGESTPVAGLNPGLTFGFRSGATISA